MWTDTLGQPRWSSASGRCVAWAILHIAGLDFGPKTLVVLCPGASLKSGQLEEDDVCNDVGRHGLASVFGGIDVGPQGLVVLGPCASLKSGQFEENVIGADVDGHVGPASVSSAGGRCVAWAILQIAGLDLGPQGLVVVCPGAGPKSSQLEEDVIGDDVDRHGPASVFGDVRPVDNASPRPVGHGFATLAFRKGIILIRERFFVEVSSENALLDFSVSLPSKFVRLIMARKPDSEIKLN